jgi:hypothetical protein
VGETTMSSVALRNNRATVLGISTAMDPPELRRARCARVLELVAAGHLQVDREVLALERVADAWHRQGASPNRKLVLRVTP